jgi:Lon-like protease
MSLLRRLPTTRLFVGAAAVLVILLLVGWFYPSDEYLYVPNRASEVAGRVTVPGEKPQKGDGGILYVDVTVRRASLLERLLPATRPDGASLVPAHAIVPEGSTFEERSETALEEMKRSERVASAVALEAAGYDVPKKAKGALIEAVAIDAPSRRQLKAGDLIVAAGGRPVRTLSQLRTQMGKVDPGESVVLGLVRREKEIEVTAKTIPDPSDRTKALIGIRVAQEADISLPVKVTIDLGRVGGPSAGLPFALDVLDELGTEVDHGYRVAATGEIAIDGSVLPVGGLKQKTYGVRQAGADVFLVPAGENAEEARRYAGNLRIVPVENFQQALRFLRTLPAK